MGAHIATTYMYVIKCVHSQWTLLAKMLSSTSSLLKNSNVFLLQEIYPPKVHEFAYVTDGACDTWDIQRTELIVLKVGYTNIHLFGIPC